MKGKVQKRYVIVFYSTTNTWVGTKNENKEGEMLIV